MNYRILILCIAGLIASGCSKPDEEGKSEQVGRDIANRMQSPIERTKEMTIKIGNLRSANSDGGAVAP